MKLVSEQDIIDAYGEECFKEFDEHMKGQTVSVNKDGSTNFETSDVNDFVSYYTRRLQRFS